MVGMVGSYNASETACQRDDVFAEFEGALGLINDGTFAGPLGQ